MPKEVIGADADGDFKHIEVKPVIFAENSEFIDSVNVFNEYIFRLHNAVLENNKGGITLYSDTSLEKEAYRIECENDEVKVYAGDKIGADYALSTLLQVSEIRDGKLILPNVKITDKPDCEYRTLMVDLARKWHDFDILLKYVDMCYFYKVKYLHLHFMDNEGYTLPSKAFPKLPTEGKHYTAEQIKELNEYARLHGVEIIPEIEMPGHAAALVTAYPEIFMSSDPNGYNPENIWIKQIMCAGRGDTVNSIKILLNEVIEMFPYSKYLHIGGDEASIGEWQSCERTQRYMKTNNISSIDEMYAEFVKKVTDYILSKGKTPIVWEGFGKEYNDRIDKRVIVVSWENYYQTTMDLAQAGFTLINCSWQPLYIVTPIKY